jgi:hypothetical protein
MAHKPPTVVQLKLQAKALGLRRYSRMRKAELLAAIEAHKVMRAHA